ncbi:MAG: sigma-70 family RNA polymerase sigma factor [Clostridium sp.]
MDYKEIETLATKAKFGDKVAEEALINAFKPCIMKQITIFNIPNYEFDDLVNECNLLIVKIIKKYDESKNCFGKFCRVAVRNLLINLLRDSDVKNFKVHSYETLEETVCDDKCLTDEVFKRQAKKGISKIIKGLTKEEKELINFIYYEGNSLTDFSKMKKISYSKARSKRDSAFNKCRKLLVKNKIAF